MVKHSEPMNFAWWMNLWWYRKEYYRKHKADSVHRVISEGCHDSQNKLAMGKFCFLVFKHKIVDNWSEKCIALWTAITLGRKQTAGKRGAVMAPAYSTGAKKRRYPTFILLPLEAMWCSVFPTNVKGIFIQANPSAALSGVILWYKNRQRML